MIDKEYPYKRPDGSLDPMRIRTFSREGKPLINLATKEVYDDAVDPYPSSIEYEEVEPITEVDDEVTGNMDHAVS